MAKQQFIDKDKGGNLRDGVEFFAVGLIVGVHCDESGPGNGDLKDFSVEYIDPWGNLQCEWRGKDEFSISPIEDADALALEIAYDGLRKSPVFLNQGQH